MLFKNRRFIKLIYLFLRKTLTEIVKNSELFSVIAFCSLEKRHGVKVGPGPRDLTQSLKVGPGTLLKFKNRTPGPPLKFKSRVPGPPSKFKNGTPSPLFN